MAEILKSRRRHKGFVIFEELGMKQKRSDVAKLEQPKKSWVGLIIQ